MAVLLNRVYSGLTSFGRNVSSYPRLRMKKLETLASPGIKSIMYKSVMEGETDDYLTYIQFFDLEYSDVKDDQFTEAETVAGKVKFHKKPSVATNPVALKCSCTDFRFCFEKELFDNKGLIGAWRKYIPVKPPSGRPPKNPKHVMGMCKHTHNLINILKSNGRVVS